jgi:hypothetical protein
LSDSSHSNRPTEEFHSTPETQTDEAYNHPEDIEHFAQHEAIERKEAEKEAKFQGITVEEALRQHEPIQGEATPPASDTDPQFVLQPGGANANVREEPSAPAVPPNPKVTRLPPPEKQDPAVKYKDASKEGAKKDEWGSGDAGYKPPTSPSEKMRKNLPYKVKPFVSFLPHTSVTLTFWNACSTNSAEIGVTSNLCLGKLSCIHYLLLPICTTSFRYQRILFGTKGLNIIHRKSRVRLTCIESGVIVMKSLGYTTNDM